MLLLLLLLLRLPQHLLLVSLQLTSSFVSSYFVLTMRIALPKRPRSARPRDSLSRLRPEKMRRAQEPGLQLRKKWSLTRHDGKTIQTPVSTTLESGRYSVGE